MEDLPTSIRAGMSAIELFLKECDQRRLAQQKGVWYEDAAKAVEVSRKAIVCLCIPFILAHNLKIQYNVFYTMYTMNFIW